MNILLFKFKAHLIIDIYRLAALFPRHANKQARYLTISRSECFMLGS